MMHFEIGLKKIKSTYSVDIFIGWNFIYRNLVISRKVQNKQTKFTSAKFPKTFYVEKSKTRGQTL